MEANKLMIGDWVFDGNEVARVTSLTCDGIIETKLRLSNIEIVTPIPLTAEILEKNGFSKTTEAEFNYYQMPDDCFEIDINNVGCAYSVDVIIKYVHQLQHALRLCGIDKEIVL